MATLKSLVDETSNIKNELVECHTNLVNNLNAKGVKVSSFDKLNTLIDKIETLKVISSIPVAGTDVLLYTDSNEVKYQTASYLKAHEYLYTGDNGVLRLSIDLKGHSGAGITSASINITRGGTITTLHTFETQASSYSTFTYNANVLSGDIITIKIKSNSQIYTCYSKNFKITCDYLIL